MTSYYYDSLCEFITSACTSGLAIGVRPVTFGDGSQPQKWAAVSDLGGKAEVLANCSAYGGPDSLGKSGFHFGVDFPDTLKDFGQADQYQQTTLCGGPFGANSTYCDTVLK